MAAGAVALAALAGFAATLFAPAAAPARIEPARAALFAQCIAGSSEIAPRAGRALRQDRTGDRFGSGQHTVCYAAVLPGRAAGETD